MKNNLINVAATLPICVLRDSVTCGKRINKFSHYNEMFRPNPKSLSKRVGNELGSYVFTPYHYHEGLEILRINEGVCHAVINKKSYTSQAGDILIINPFEAHGIYLEEKSANFSRDCISFVPDHLFPDGSIFESAKNAVFNNFLSGDSRAQIYLIIERIITASESADAGWGLSVLGGIMEFYSVATRLKACSYERTEHPLRREFMMQVRATLMQIFLMIFQPQMPQHFVNTRPHISAVCSKRASNYFY